MAEIKYLLLLKTENSSSDAPRQGIGLARLLAFVQRCLPDSAPRTAEEEETARLLDWRNVQAAVSPSLLPDLKFHDLVFGAVLGEGAFSVVKYARHIVKVLDICQNSSDRRPADRLTISL